MGTTKYEAAFGGGLSLPGICRSGWRVIFLPLLATHSQPPIREKALGPEHPDTAVIPFILQRGWGLEGRVRFLPDRPQQGPLRAPGGPLWSLRGASIAPRSALHGQRAGEALSPQPEHGSPLSRRRVGSNQQGTTCRNGRCSTYTEHCLSSQSRPPLKSTTSEGR